MKRFLQIIFLTLIFGGIVFAQTEKSAAPALNATQTKLEQEFRQLILEMQDGAMNGDKALAEQTLADGYISTRENGSNGGGKPQALKSRSNPEAFRRAREELAEVKYTQSMEDVRVEPHGDTVAVNYRLVTRLTISGEPVIKQFRCNQVFIKRDGRWQSILYAEVVIPGEPFAAKIDTKVYEDYVGEYRLNSKRTYLITREGDKLFFTRILFLKPEIKVELVPESETTFAQNGGNYYRISFVRNDKRQVTHLRMKEFSGVEYNAIKIK
ncbi:MAG: DUF4440 domain-containing protein [Acidobacteriota bacterium]|nr:DUF4440 domain-containing protein [Acidobacteriota bacterium]